MKIIVVLGAGGFIGSHLVKRLKSRGEYVIGIDLKYPEFSPSPADEFIIGDLRDYVFTLNAIPENCVELYQFAADMGGAGYVFSGENDAEILHNSLQINLNVSKIAYEKKVGKVFFASSACVYPQHNQQDAQNPNCAEHTAYPADPDSDYGWEKLTAERIYLSFYRNFGLEVRIARFHNVYGPECAWNNGKEKAPAALCRKVIEQTGSGEIEIWGDGSQTRSFLYIDDALDALQLLMDSDYRDPINIGSTELISIADLVKLIASIDNKGIQLKTVSGPIGVKGRVSDNDIILSELNWEPQILLSKGLKDLYFWTKKMI